MPKCSDVPRPCLKWAGGKRELIKKIDENGYIPEDIGTYYEPFFGAGAVYFHLWNSGRIKKAVLSDLNFELYNVHDQIKKNVDDLLDYCENMNLTSNERTYYQNRDRFNELKMIECTEDELLERAILMIYLNKTSYSGMYRENKSGGYNVPFGYYHNPTIIDKENLKAMHESFENVVFKHGDYEKILRYRHFKTNDFVYMDPPYMPCKGVSEFRSYVKTGFDQDDQERLAKQYAKLNEKKIKVMLSNSTSKIVLNLYTPIHGIKIETIYAKRAINARNEGWNHVKEYLIMNY